MYVAAKGDAMPSVGIRLATVAGLAECAQVRSVVVGWVIINVIDFGGHSGAAQRADRRLTQHSSAQGAPCLAIESERSTVALLLVLERSHAISSAIN